MKKMTDKKIAIGIVIFFCVLISLYAINGFYKNDTGKIVTEYALKDTYQKTINVEGFAVRDEYRQENGEVVSILKEIENAVYVPIISDGENVAKNGVIAFAFDSEAAAENYLRVNELGEKIQAIEELKNHESLSYKNVIFLNSQINAGVKEYIKAISSNDLASLSFVAQNVSRNMTAKQIAIGKEIDFDSIINDYKNEIKELKSTYKTNKTLTSPFAGYFVSNVDGFENAISYESAENKEIESGEGTRLINTKPASTDGLYGKVISQHTWYYIFDINITDASPLKRGKTVKVSFEEVGVKDIKMSVHDISEQKDGKVTITLKCTYMNEEIAVLRKEKASIVAEEYTGLRISNEAIRENDEGLKGVYVLYGEFIKFAPINELYIGEDYVIAEKYVVELEEEDGDETSEETKYYELEQYDRIIVKGINLKDGMLIS